MEGIWLISYIVLWVVVLLLGIVILAHSRLIGILHHRLRPSAARQLADGPEIGTKLKDLDGKKLDGTRWVWDFPASTELLLAFLSPQCQTCNDLIPHLKDFVKTYQDVTVVLLSVLDHLPMNQAYASYSNLEKMNYVISSKLANDFAIEGTPYFLRVNEKGVVVAKGLVNNYEHLVSLINYSPKDQ